MKFSFKLSKRIYKIILSGLTVVVLVTVGFFLWNKPTETKAGWWNDSWSYRKAININGSKVTGNLTNFPLLVSLTDSDLAVGAQEDGDDIVFTTDKGEILKHEIEKYASTTGELVAWVKMPELISDMDTYLYMYYGNAGVSTQEDPENVWDENYKMVHHLEEGGTGTRYDSTVNRNDGGTTGYDASSAVTAKINGGDYFNGADQITIPNSDSIFTATGSSFTVSLWFKAPDTAGIEHLVGSISDSYWFDLGNPGWSVFIRDSGAGGLLKFAALDSNGVRAETYGSIVDDDEWHYVSARLTPSGLVQYLDGVGDAADTDTPITGSFPKSWAFYIGCDEYNQYHGIIDEVRFSNSVRSSSWIRTEYNNQSSTSTFYSVQSQETGPGPVAYWSFDEGAGSTAFDESGQGYHARITGPGNAATTSVQWGVRTNPSTNTTYNALLCMGSTSPNIAGMILSKIEIRSNGSGNARLAVFQGGSLSSPAGANLVWDAGEVAAGSGNWVGISGGTASLAPASTTWVCVKSDDSTFGMYYANTWQGFQYSTGRFVATGMSTTSESVVFESPFPAGGSLSTAWYALRIVYERQYPQYDVADTWVPEGECISGSCLLFGGNGNHVEASNAFIGSTEATSTGSSVNIAAPFLTRENDIMFAFGLRYNNVTAPTVVPTGWTLIASNTEPVYSTYVRQFLYYKIAEEGDNSSSYTWSWSSSADGAITIASYRGGFDPADPLDVISNTAYNSSNSTIRAASMTVAASNSPLMLFASSYTAYNMGDLKFSNPTAPTGDWSEDYEGGISEEWHVNLGRQINSMVWNSSGSTGNIDISQFQVMGYELEDIETEYITNPHSKHAFAVALNPSPVKIIASPADLTVSVWVKPVVSAGGKAVMVKNSALRLATGSSGQPVCQIYNGSTWSAAATSSRSLTINQWAHLSCTYDRSNIKIYINGLPDGSVAQTATVNDSSEPWQIGKDDSGAYADWQGYMDEARIYPYARTQAQAGQDFAAGQAAAKVPHGISAGFGAKSDNWITDGLVAYWKMDESTFKYSNFDADGTAFDSSGNNYNLINNNTPYRAAKFGYGAGCFNGVSSYLAATSTIDGIKSVSFWVNSTSTAGYFMRLKSSPDVSITSNSGIVSATGFVSPIIYINGLPTDHINNTTWQLVTVTTETPITADDIEIGRVTSYLSDGSLIDDVRLYTRKLAADEVLKLYNWAPPPMIYLSFDEKSGNTLYDFGGLDNHAKLVDGLNRVKGKYRGGIEFNGEDYGPYVAFENNGRHELREGDKMTVSFWVNPATTDLKDIIERNMHWNIEQRYAIGFQFLTEDCGGAGAYIYYDLNSKVNKWLNLTVTYDDTSKEVTGYIDGAFISRQTMAGGCFPNDENLANYPLLLGVTPWAPWATWEGKMDELRIYNYIRNPKQIMEDMHGKPGLYPVLSLYFDEGKGSTAYNTGLATTSGVLYPGTGGTNTASSAMWTLDGKFGKAMEFDGTDDYVKVNNSYWLRTPEFSVSYWVKAKTQDTNYQVNVQKLQSNDTNGYVFLLNPNNDASYPSKIRFNLAKSGTDYPLYSTTTIQNGQWYHVVGTYSNSVSRLYINGILESSTSTADYNTTNDPMYVGIDDGNPAWGPFDGQIDELKVYSYELSPDDVKTDYNQGKAAVMGQTGQSSSAASSSNSASLEYCVPGSTDYCAGPLAEWKMDEKTSGGGIILYDTSGNGYNATGTATATAAILNCGAPGKFGSACEFTNADDDVFYAHYSGLTASVFTVGFWLFPRSANDYNQSFSARNGWGAFEFHTESGGGVYVGTDMANRFTPTNLPDGTLEINNWQYFNFIYDGTYGYFYKNGILLAGPKTMNTPSAWGGFEIGNIGLGDDNIDGKVDQVRIYNYARTQAQIAYDFNRGKPIAHWRFDECKGSTIYDSAVSWNGGTANNGTLYLGTSVVTATGTCASSSDSFWSNGSSGKINSAGSFDGTDDYVNVGNDSSLSLTGPMTICSWIYADTLAESDYYSGIVNNFTAGTVGQYCLQMDENGKLEFIWSPDGSNVERYDTNENVIVTGQWYHVCAARVSDSNVDFYVNGLIKADTSVGDVSIPSSAGSTVISDDYATYNWDGLIDEVKIWNYALTAEQVNMDYNGGAVRFGQ